MSNRRRPAPSKPNSLKVALARKTIRTTHFDIPLEPAEKVDEIAHRLNLARQALAVAPYRDPDEKPAGLERRLADLQKRVDKVKDELDACFWRLEFRALPGDDDLDRLLNQYPATEEQIEKAKSAGAKPDEMPTVDLDSFHVAYLMACLVNPDPDMTFDDWRAELWNPDRWTSADREDLFGKVRAANDRPFSAGISFE